MPETKEKMLAEIDRLEEWCIAMWEMILSDGSVPANMMGMYIRQVEDGQVRLADLKAKAKENSWTA